jgi:hypothetical protein
MRPTWMFHFASGQSMVQERTNEELLYRGATPVPIDSALFQAILITTMHVWCEVSSGLRDYSRDRIAKSEPTRLDQLANHPEGRSYLRR